MKYIRLKVIVVLISVLLCSCKEERKTTEQIKNEIELEAIQNAT